ncbi:Endonuclease/exonuclease/phosphatase [Parachaetomium inaequale]|uniref:Endonuclease/exonuclease/phosphatase n=1 Tax=Parachaetomium inaequale TaxID=2588326 RepID=A0AAN6PCX6_9PEZI|nr:Endonuclease/exonuclease/phosphatase [Parachaetomium inaequale]
MKPSRRLNAALATTLLLGRCLAATSGRFSVLSMNVAGLPAILNNNDVPGDKATNAASIGSKFAEYGHDVIHVQEDFNYHAHIYRTDTHSFRTATSGGVPFGSGLNTLSNFDWVDFRRVKWDECSDASGADCLTPKGFTFMRVAIAGPTDNSTAVYVDFYNLHTDAGGEDQDLAARQHNVNQVAGYISEWSKGNAVVVYGDLNSRYSRTADTAIRALLASENAAGPGLTDAWIELRRGGVVPTEENVCGNPASDSICEVVDKVFYRSSPLVTLQAETFRYASNEFLQADGNVLSDHNPVFVEFAWSAGSSLRQSDFSGGTSGTWFSDVPALAGITDPKPVTLTFGGGSRLDRVGLTRADGTRLSHGGAGGTEVSLELGPSEYWVEAELCRGERSGKTRNFYMRAATSLGRTLTAGTPTTDCAVYSAPDGWQIAGFVGQDGDEIDQLALVYAPQ